MDITPDKEMVKPTHHNFTQGEAFKHMFGGIHFKFPTFKHDHQPVMNVNAVADDQLTTGHPDSSNPSADRSPTYWSVATYQSA